MPSSIPQLNPEQKKAAEAPISPLLIVAGAGTGKTRTLTSRILYLIATGTPPERICAITFTNKAAQEMKERIAAMTGGAKGMRTPYLGTFHSLGASILRKECRVFGREPNFAIFDDHDSFDLIKKAVKVVLLDKKNTKEVPAFFAKKISEIKNLGDTRGINQKGVESGTRRSSMGSVASMKSVGDSEKMAQVARVFERYEAALQQNNAFDFDDLIAKPVAMFKAHPEILKKYQQKYDAVLVDEYQDINPKQYELIKLLAGGHNNITVVGDDEQTIYTWRYADIKIFLDFDKDWPNAAVHFLEENYRSTGNIINGASAVVQNNRFRTPKKLWTKESNGEPITIYEAWGENEEAAWIAQEISAIRNSERNANGLQKTSASIADTSTTNMETPPSVAILYRTNAQSRALEQALIRENIPYKIFGGLKFYERREVKDIVAALRYISNPRDEISRERLEKNLTKRKFAAFKKAVAPITTSATIETNPISESPTDGANGPKPADIIKVFLESFDYINYLESNFINANERQENILELIRFATEFQNLPDLLERLSLVQATDDIAASDQQGGTNPTTTSWRGQPVHLSTIHLAKGLEFDVVFIAGAAEGFLPHGRSIDNDASLEEERRLMYVAMTRARKKLFISFFGLPSRFIAEIPEENVQLAMNTDSYGESKVTYRDFEPDAEYEEF